MAIQKACRDVKELPRRYLNFVSFAQCQRPVEGPIITLDLSETQEAAEETGADEVNKAALDDNSQHFPAESSPAAEAMQPRLTPRKLLRKAAPKRKRLGSQAEAQGEMLTGIHVWCICIIVAVLIYPVSTL